MKAEKEVVVGRCDSKSEKSESAGWGAVAGRGEERGRWGKRLVRGKPLWREKKG